jgi:predicted metal-binding membrane protein
MNRGDAALAGVLKRDRFVVIIALIVLTALACGYVLWVRAGMFASSPQMPSMTMTDMAAMVSPRLAEWTPAYFAFIFAMWAVMMMGMMTPSAAPMILLYLQVARQASTLGRPFAPAAWFAGGYLLAWTVFALLATLAQYGLERLTLLTPMMESSSRTFGGAVLIAAGLYQWVPFKYACLAQCRAPLSFIQHHGGFRADGLGSLRLGLRHGAYCVGCCWALMALLFVGGVMNVLWIAGLMIFVLAEKVLPGGRFVSRVAGFAAMAAGAWYLAAG